MLEVSEIMDRIHEEVDCREVVEDMLGLDVEKNRYSRQIAMLCINHDDQHYGSCFVKHDYVHCFACGWHADAVGIVMKALDCSWIDAVKALDNHFGLNLDLEKDREYDPDSTIRISSSELALIGINEKQTLKLLFEKDRDQFWRYLAVCCVYADRRYTAAEGCKYEEVEAILAKQENELAELINKFRELKKKDKPHSKLIILS